MIIKFNKYNESIKSLLVGPTVEEMWKNLMNGKLKEFIKTIPESPEDFFNKMKDGCKEISKDRDSIYWGKKGIIFFEHNTTENVLYINDDFIWIILENVYGLDYYKIKELIKNELKDDINWKDLIPLSSWQSHG